MLQHYFKLVWARRKQYFMIMATLFLAFLTISFFGSLVLKRLLYMWKSTGLSYEYVYSNSLQSSAKRNLQFNIGDPNLPPDSIPEVDAQRAAFMQIVKQLELEPEIQNISVSPGPVPFNFNSGTWQSIYFNEQEMRVVSYFFDDHFTKVIGLPLKEGRWFKQEDNQATIPPIIITMNIVRKFFPNRSPIGEIIQTKHRNKDPENYRIIGVIDIYRPRPDELPDPTIIKRYQPSEPSALPPREILASYHPGTDLKDIDEKLKQIGATIPIRGGWWYRDKGRSLEEIKEDNMQQFMMPLAIALAIALILLSNVAIGIFGVFWQNVLRRTSELGIRRAMGSTQKGIHWLILGESLAIATISIMLGTILFIQIPIAGYSDISFVDALTGIGFSTVFIYILVVGCSLYPAFLAGKIQPAIALMEE